MKRADVHLAEALLAKGNTSELVAQVIGVSGEVLEHCLELSRDRRRSVNPKPRPPNSDDLRAADLYRSGKSIADVAHAFGRSIGWATAALRRTGTPTRSKGPMRKEERNAEIVRRFNAGEKAAVIARDMNVTRERVRQILVQHGLRRSVAEMAEHAQKERDEKILRYHADGLTAPEIAECLGISSGTVCSRLRKNGISTRKSRMSVRTREALRMFDSGASVAEITHVLGYTNKDCCLTALHRYGRTQQRRVMQQSVEAA